MKKNICILFVFLFVIGGLQAQVFTSKKLSQIGDKFLKNCLPKADSVFSCEQITKSKSFIVSYNKKGEIEHLGVSLFSPQTKEMINEPVCDFIERQILELLLLKSPMEIKTKLRDYKIVLQKNGVEFGKPTFNSLNDVLAKIQHPTQFSLKKNKDFVAIWEFGKNESLIMRFPVSRELIFGTDKAESDSKIGELFNSDKCQGNFKTDLSQMVSPNDLMKIEGTDLYKLSGNQYLTAKISSDTFYQRSANKYSLTFNSQYPYESLSNLFITHQIENSLVLKITHKKYGGFTPEFPIPLNRFFCLFDNEFITYTAFEKTDFKNIEISVFLQNRDFNYVHFLKIKTTTEQLFKKNGILKADLYTNIPLENVKNLFE